LILEIKATYYVSSDALVDLHVLPISGTYVVLGIQWLKPLGPIVTTYSTMTMRFMKEVRMVELSVNTPSAPQDISAHQLKRIFQTDAAAAYFHIQILPILPHLNHIQLPPYSLISPAFLPTPQIPITFPSPYIFTTTSSN